MKPRRAPELVVPLERSRRRVASGFCAVAARGQVRRWIGARPVRPHVNHALGPAREPVDGLADRLRPGSGGARHRLRAGIAGRTCESSQRDHCERNAHPPTHLHRSMIPMAVPRHERVTFASMALAPFASSGTVECAITAVDWMDCKLAPRLRVSEGHARAHLAQRNPAIGELFEGALFMRNAARRLSIASAKS